LPQLALSKFDDKLAQEAFEAPKTGAGQVADVGAQIAGLVGGGAAKLGVGAGKLAAKQLLRKICCCRNRCKSVRRGDKWSCFRGVADIRSRY